MTTETPAPASASVPATQQEQPQRDAHNIDLSQSTEQPFLRSESEYRIVLAKSAHDDILAHAATNPNIELCGVLVGKLFHDDNGPYLLISDVVRGREAREEASNVTFTHSTWELIHKEMDEKHADSRIVGWYHMHPGFGVFLSEVDVFAHSHFFNAAWQVALVVDPKGQTEGFFHFKDGQIVRTRRYWIGDELRWVPGRRPQTSIPPGTSIEFQPARIAAPAQSPASSAAPMDDGYTLRDILLIGLPIILCLFLLFWNIRASFVNSRLMDKNEQLQSQLLLQDRSTAMTTALWLRQRLDAGAKSGSLLPVYQELRKMDPSRKKFYAALLPELSDPVDDRRTKKLRGKSESASGPVKAKKPIGLKKVKT
ncbi:MAG: hypothetical protein IID45_07850 [Planctomycetes bacterium]|nr:hypothetical protein [Planctomycetota bacterium]